MSATTQDATPAGPVIRIERGSPSPEDLAALTVVLAATRGPAPDATPSRRPRGWSSRRRTLNAGAVRGAGWGGSLTG